MTKTVLFVTGNASKIDQAKEILDTYNIELTTDSLDVHEIQSAEPLEIVKQKVLATYEKLQKPLVVCDHFWEFNALHGWPGGYMKDMNSWLTEGDFINLMRGKTDRSVTLTEAIAYTTDGKHIEIFNLLHHSQVG